MYICLILSWNIQYFHFLIIYELKYNCKNYVKFKKKLNNFPQISESFLIVGNVHVLFTYVWVK